MRFVTSSSRVVPELTFSGSSWSLVFPCPWIQKIDETVGAGLAHIDPAKLPHEKTDLLAHDVHHRARAVLAGRRHAEHRRSAEERGLGAEAQRLPDVAAAPEPAVDQ